MNVDCNCNGWRLWTPRVARALLNMMKHFSLQPDQQRCATGGWLSTFPRSWLLLSLFEHRSTLEERNKRAYCITSESRIR